MRSTLIFLWIIVICLASCETSVNKEISKQLSLDEEKIYYKLKFLIECNTCNPTKEELFYYYELRNRMFPMIRANAKFSQSPEIDESKITPKNLANNEFLKYDFSFSPPTIKLPPYLRGSGTGRPNFYSPTVRERNYRYPSPINVKPGHQF